MVNGGDFGVRLKHSVCIAACAGDMDNRSQRRQSERPHRPVDWLAPGSTRHGDPLRTSVCCSRVAAVPVWVPWVSFAVTRQLPMHSMVPTGCANQYREAIARRNRRLHKARQTPRPTPLVCRPARRFHRAHVCHRGCVVILTPPTLVSTSSRPVYLPAKRECPAVWSRVANKRPAGNDAGRIIGIKDSCSSGVRRGVMRSCFLEVDSVVA
jgi:hypothetical protein